MDIRRADHADLDDIIRIGDQVLARHATDYPEEFVYPMDDGAMRGFFGKAKHEIIVACGDDGTVLGYLWFERQDRRRNAFKFAKKRLYVHHVGVDGAAQGRGVGTALFDHVTAVARGEKRGELALDFWNSNTAAHGFFAARGFEPTQLVFVRRLTS